jgi:hypothetical protein
MIELNSVLFCQNSQKRIKEKRRIGVGYRDKGSAPKSHEVFQKEVRWAADTCIWLDDLSSEKRNLLRTWNILPTGEDWFPLWRFRQELGWGPSVLSLDLDEEREKERFKGFS